MTYTQSTCTTLLAKRALLAVAASLSLTATSSAVPIFDAFGPFPNATFGGTGIPNDAVAASVQIVDGDNTITIALAATQRFSNPPLTNDGAGTFFATPGSNFGGAGESSTEGALWNFNTFIGVEGSNGSTPVLADYQIDVFYDFDPATDTPIGSLGRVDVTGGLAATPNETLVEGSENLLFDFLENPVFPASLVVFPPAGSFDPNALGEYTFAITVSDPNSGFPVETVSIDVVVIPEPATLSLVGLIAAVSLATRRRR